MNKFSRLTVAALLASSAFGGAGASRDRNHLLLSGRRRRPVTKIIDDYGRPLQQGRTRTSR